MVTFHRGRGGGVAAETDPGIAVINHRNISRLSGDSAKDGGRAEDRKPERSQARG